MLVHQRVPQMHFGQMLLNNVDTHAAPTFKPDALTEKWSNTGLRETQKNMVH